MSPFNVTNEATAPSAALVAVLGLRMYFRKQGDADWHDFGHVRNPNREQDLTELDIKSARLGRLATIKKVTTEVSLEYTFESISVLDLATVGLHTAGPFGAAEIGDGAFYAVEEFLGNEGELLVVQPNAETGGVVKVGYFPHALLKGDGEESGDGETESQLTFRATIMPAETFAVPATLATGTPYAPYGFRYFAPAASLDDVLDAISDGGYEVPTGDGDGDGGT